MLCAWGARCSARQTHRPQRRVRSEATFRSLWAATFAMAPTPWQAPKKRLSYGSTTMRCSPGRITRMLGCTSDCKCLARQDRMQVQIYLRHAGSWLHRGLCQHGYYMDRVLWDAYGCAALEPQEKPLDSRPSSRRFARGHGCNIGSCSTCHRRPSRPTA